MATAKKQTAKKTAPRSKPEATPVPAPPQPLTVATYTVDAESTNFWIGSINRDGSFEGKAYHPSLFMRTHKQVLLAKEKHPDLQFGDQLMVAIYKI